MNKINHPKLLTVAAPSTEQLGAIRALPYGFADLDRADRCDDPDPARCAAESNSVRYITSIAA